MDGVAVKGASHGLCRVDVPCCDGAGMIPVGGHVFHAQRLHFRVLLIVVHLVQICQEKHGTIARTRSSISTRMCTGHTLPHPRQAFDLSLKASLCVFEIHCDLKGRHGLAPNEHHDPLTQELSIWYTLVCL